MTVAGQYDPSPNRHTMPVTGQLQAACVFTSRLVVSRDWLQRLSSEKVVRDSFGEQYDLPLFLQLPPDQRHAYDRTSYEARDVHVNAAVAAAADVCLGCPEEVTLQADNATDDAANAQGDVVAVTSS